MRSSPSALRYWAACRFPRTPAEIVNGEVVTKDGVSVDAAFRAGAARALAIAKENGVELAILQPRSPQLRCCRSIRWNLHRQKDPRPGRICGPAAGKRHPRAGCRYFRQYRTILSADAASEKYKLLSKKRR